MWKMVYLVLVCLLMECYLVIDKILRVIKLYNVMGVLVSYYWYDGVVYRKLGDVVGKVGLVMDSVYRSDLGMGIGIRGWNHVAIGKIGRHYDEGPGISVEMLMGYEWGNGLWRFEVSKEGALLMLSGEVELPGSSLVKTEWRVGALGFEDLEMEKLVGYWGSYGLGDVDGKSQGDLVDGLDKYLLGLLNEVYYEGQDLGFRR